MGSWYQDSVPQSIPQSSWCRIPSRRPCWPKVGSQAACGSQLCRANRMVQGVCACDMSLWPAQEVWATEGPKPSPLKTQPKARAVAAAQRVLKARRGSRKVTAQELAWKDFNTGPKTAEALYEVGLSGPPFLLMPVTPCHATTATLAARRARFEPCVQRHWILQAQRQHAAVAGVEGPVPCPAIPFGQYWCPPLQAVHFSNPDRRGLGSWEGAWQVTSE